VVSKEVLAERFDSLIRQILPLVFGIVVLASFLFGVIIFLVRKITFDAKHMMTRQEVEQEAKEYEVDQNMKRAQYERRNS
jgi:flagellar biosynthesis protein FlhB